jgi:hypothetical protein
MDGKAGYFCISRLGGPRSGRELARSLAVGRSALRSLGFPRAANIGDHDYRLFQLPPFEPGMRFFRTRPTDVLHLRCAATSTRQAWFGLSATTSPLRLTSPSRLSER